jgi:hypothetical protein
MKSPTLFNPGKNQTGIGFLLIFKIRFGQALLTSPRRMLALGCFGGVVSMEWCMLECQVYMGAAGWG